MRFAGGLAKLLPKMTPFEAAMRFTPDVVSAALTAEGLRRQGGDLPGIIGATGEDVAYSLLAGIAGNRLGKAAARAANARGKNWDPGQMGTLVETATTMPVQFLAPRPLYDNALKNIYERQSQQQRAMDEFEQQKLDEQLLFGGLGAGYGLGTSGLGLGGRML